MKPSVLEELRLTSFKSFRKQSVSLSDLTLLIGRNGAGKSQGVGCGDLTILIERDRYLARMAKGTVAVIWTLDSKLASYL